MKILKDSSVLNKYFEGGHEKAINTEVQCFNRTMDDEMAEFFKGR